MGQGRYYQPTIYPEDINATASTTVPPEPNLSVTIGCPCDVCDIKKGCVTECARFKMWVIKGPTKAQKQEALEKEQAATTRRQRHEAI